LYAATIPIVPKINTDPNCMRLGKDVSNELDNIDEIALPQTDPMVAPPTILKTEL
jgi:hypothetical protein